MTATAKMTGNVLTVSTGKSKIITVGKLNRDSKTGDMLEFVGQVTRQKVKHPYVFVNNKTGKVTRHSVAYIAKYIGQ
jgi:hypothetical protein